MTVVLLPNAGFLSETTRMLAVYQELKKLGTPAVLATHGGTYEGVLREARISWEEIPPKQIGAIFARTFGEVPDEVVRFLDSQRFT